MTISRNTRIIASGAVGNMLEWYDFSVYGYFAATIGRVFFPREHVLTQLFAAFGIFAVGFLMRPVGAVLIGYLGDRFGRRAALTFSVAAMAIPTFLLGTLPTYQSLGVAAPIFLILLRMIQGLSVGGEYTTSIIFMVEQSAPGRRGLIGALAACGASGGILLGSATGALLGWLLTPEALSAWGWRIPFLLGLILGIVGFFLRRNLPEAPARPAAAHSPLLDTFRRHPATLLRLAAFSMFNSVSFYVMFVYIVTWFGLADGLGPSRALEINSLNMVVLLFALFGMGWLSDRIGRKPVLLAATALGLATALPLFWMMHHPSPTLVFFGQMGFVFIIGASLGVQPTAMVETTPLAVRCTAIAIGYNVTFGVIGGLTPLLATWFIGRTGYFLSPAWLIMGAAIISFVAVLGFKETYRDALDVA